MKTWIALLRGINVGGNHIIPMLRLRALLAELGYEDVATYIQSGNCVFRTTVADAKTIASGIAGKIEEVFGFRPSVFALTLDALEKAQAGNPFAGGDPKFVHLFFLDRAVGKLDEKAMRALARKSDDFALIGTIFYLHTPEGFGNSKLADKLAKFLPVDMTARNLRSVTRIVDMARAAGK